jgi:hypothetical protein
MTMVVYLLLLFNVWSRDIQLQFFFTTLSQPNPGTLTAQLNETQPIKNNHSIFLQSVSCHRVSAGTLDHSAD